MGICCSCDNTPEPPENIIPDPKEPENAEDAATQITIKKLGWSGLSRDYQVFRSHAEPAEENRWLFLNKSGSKWGGQCKIALENFVRLNPEAPKQGQMLWEADFKGMPYFSQYLRTSDQNAIDLMFSSLNEMGPFWASGPVGMYGLRAQTGGRWGDGRNWGNDDFYINRHRGRSVHGNFLTTLFINWTMNATATLSTSMRTGYGGRALELTVYAVGTALCEYFVEHKPVYEDRDSGDGTTRKFQVGTREEINRFEREFVDQIQYALLDAESKAPVCLPNGEPAVWKLDGDVCDWLDNYSCPFFSVRQTGGWFTKDPARITTAAGVDPALSMLLAHLATTEYSAGAIKKALNPDFPYDPRAAIIFGMMNKAPPPPPPIVVVQTLPPPPVVMMTYATPMAMNVSMQGGVGANASVAMAMPAMSCSVTGEDGTTASVAMGMPVAGSAVAVSTA